MTHQPAAKATESYNPNVGETYTVYLADLRFKTTTVGAIETLDEIKRKQHRNERSGHHHRGPLRVS
jgi:hypothetical protein